MPSFYNLESIQTYGVPTTVDGVDLTLTQARVLVGIVGRVMDEAGHKFDRAVGLALNAFRRMYDKTEDGWVARRTVQLGKDHGGTIPNRHYQVDREERRRMARKRSKTVAKKKDEQRSPARRVLESLTEAGARNSQADRKAIVDVVKLAFGQLNKQDQVDALRALGVRVRRRKS